MRRHATALTLTEAIVVVILTLLIAVLIIPGFITRPPHDDRRLACAPNLGQIAMACVNYSEPYGDFWPCHWDGNTIYGEEVFTDTDGDGCGDTLRTGTTKDPRDGRTFEQALRARDPWNNPMQSLSLLYPGWIDDERVFRCYSTKDDPRIAVLDIRGSRHNAFGKVKNGYILSDGVPTDPARASGAETATRYKCSYLYDSLTHFRKVGPGHAMAADADGFTCKLPNGDPPAYPDNWKRVPRKPNHDNGQNVMFFDGRVKWCSDNYASEHASDNIFVPNGPLTGSTAPNDVSWLLDNSLWDQDTDAWLWDEANIGIWQWEG